MSFLLLGGFSWLSAASSTIDSLLFDAYLRADMSTWAKFLDTAQWTPSSPEQQRRILSIEYGYVATQLSEDHDKSEPLLLRFEQHVEEMQNDLPRSLYCCYQSSINAYWYMLYPSRLNRGLASFQLAKEALQTDPNDPMANILYANVLFYAPKLFGGNKKEAKRLFIKAEQLFRQQNRPYVWNYLATLMGIAQCLEKTESKEAAIAKCQDILHEYPTFHYIRDEYLPYLMKK